MLDLHYRRYLILLVLLFATPAFGADVLAPDDAGSVTTISPWVTGDNSCDGSDCATALCETFIDDDPSSPDADDYIMVNTDTASTLIQIFFPTPSSAPSTTALDQSLSSNWTRVTVDGSGTGECDETTGGTDPRFELRLFCSGTLVVLIADTQIVDSLDLEFNHTFTWPGAVGDCDAAGANMEIRITMLRRGGGGNKRLPALNAMEWNVTHISAGTRNRFKLIGDIRRSTDGQDNAGSKQGIEDNRKGRADRDHRDLDHLAVLSWH